MANYVDFETACKISRIVFGHGGNPVTTHYSFVIVSGSFRLQIIRECVVRNQVYCRLEIFSGMVGQLLGYFYYDMEFNRISSLHKED